MDPKFMKYILAGIAMMIAVPAVSAITIDGNPDEWGSDGFLTGDWSLNKTWVPDLGTWYIVEDNRNPKRPLSAGNPYTGVHIKTAGSTFTFYDEPMVQLFTGDWITEPYEGEKYDQEAMYIREDASNVYILIVTSLDPEEAYIGDAPGDLRIDVNKTKNSGDGTQFEMGVKLGKKTGLSQFGIYEVASWKKAPKLIPENWPGVIGTGTKVGDAVGVYKKCDIGCNEGTNADNGFDTYIIELAIPKSLLTDDTSEVTADDFSINDSCTNDVIKIPIPEFATVALPIAAILGLVFVLRMRRKEH
ncbi:MAG: PEF-CTERM sorting domain-containing protein [Candidatus Methanoperedens sp.]|nr:PEF-CTERM sorting domain-containing protein [Candidatus Methanoperedens sp.]